MREVPEMVASRQIGALGKNLPKPLLRDVGEVRARKVHAQRCGRLGP